MKMSWTSGFTKMLLMYSSIFSMWMSLKLQLLEDGGVRLRPQGRRPAEGGKVTGSVIVSEVDARELEGEVVLVGEVDRDEALAEGDRDGGDGEAHVVVEPNIGYQPSRNISGAARGPRPCLRGGTPLEWD